MLLSHICPFGLTRGLVYTPPNAEYFGCQIFDEQTGKASHVSQANFFSVVGHKL